MNGYLRLGAALGSSVLVWSVTAAAIEPGPVTLTKLDGTNVRLADQRAPYAAIHFLPAQSATQLEGHINEFTDAGGQLAGLAQWFVVQSGEASARELQIRLGSSSAMLALDTDGGLARRFKADAGTHLLIVVDRDGRELVRMLNPSDVAEFTGKFNVATKPEAVAQYNLPKGDSLALDGYDPVAYFTEGKAAKGDAKIAARFRSVEYRFASEAHRTLFIADPERFLPTYGGWCASAMGDRGAKVSIDPTNFKVKDGRLFLFYKSLIGDAKKDWDKREREWEPAADTFWKKLSGEDAIKPPTK